jgi:hypothetical protein
MTRRNNRHRNPRDGEVAGTLMIAAHRASDAVALTRAFRKSRLSSLGALQTPGGPRSFQARTSLPPKAADCAPPSAPHAGDPIDVEFTIKS